MTFYRNTRIEYWQSGEQSALRVAFQESRKRHTCRVVIENCRKAGFDTISWP